MKKSLVISAFCAVLFLIFSYPLLFRFSSSVFGDPQWPFDTYGTLYSIWWLKTAFLNGWNPDLNTLLGYPFSVNLSHLPQQPLLTYPLILFALIGGEVFAYNLYVLICFALTGAVMGALCYYCTRNTLGSFLGALIFTFSPNHMLQTMSHLGMSSIQWSALFVLSWLLLLEKRSWKTILFCAISIGLLFLSNYYLFYFSIYFVICFFVVALWMFKQFPWSQFIKSLCIVGLLCALFMSPQIIKLAGNYFSVKTTSQAQSSGYQRSMNDLYKYAARPSDYLLPSEYHPVLGNVTLWAQKHVLKRGRHWSDRTLYLGIVPLVMMSLLWFYRRKISTRDRFIVNLCVFGFFFFIWLSFPPWVSLGPISVPTPSALLYYVFPMFRYYSRAGFYVALFSGIMAAYSWKYLSSKILSKQKRSLLFGFICCFLLFEFLVVPPKKNINIANVPPVYSWLAKQSGEFAVIEYPYGRPMEERQQKMIYYQSVHQKPLVNAGMEGTLSDMLRKKAQDINDPELWSLLSYYGTRFVIVHENTKRFEKVPSLIKVKDFETSSVYEIKAPERSVYTLLWNFGRPQKGSDGQYWRWIGQTAKIWCLNTQEKDIQIQMKIKVLSPSENRLHIILNEKEVFESYLKSGDKTALQIETHKLTLFKGENWIQLVPDRMVSHPDDSSRKISFFVSSIELSVSER